MKDGSKLQVSIVSPVYNAEQSIDELIAGVTSSMESLTPDYEIILVDDGSPDRSWETIERACHRSRKVKGIKLSRNYGQHYAITAGLEFSQGDSVVVLDCDLQHDPVYIKDLLAARARGFDVVYTMGDKRSHPFFKNIASRFFYAVFNLLTDTNVALSNVGSYSLLSRKAVNAFCRFKDYHRHYLLVVRLLGFPSTQVTIVHQLRKHGKSSYTLSKLIRHAIDGITSQSNKLLRIIVNFGLLFVCGSFLATLLIIYRYTVHGFLPGWTSLIVVILLCTGVILISLGVIGIYISKIFDQVKNRPLYLVDQLLNVEE